MTYVADENGYVADVKYEGEAQYPKYEPKKSSYRPEPSYKPSPSPAPAYTPAFFL